jgi:hypothetical protein
VQAAGLTYGCGLNYEASFPGAVVAGDFLAAVVLTANPTAVSLTVTDTLSHAWKSTRYRLCGLGQGAAIYYVENAMAGIDRVTVTQSQATSTDASCGTGGSTPLGLALFEYAGLAQANALDVEASQCAPSTTQNMSTPSITTSSPDLLVGLFADKCGGGQMDGSPDWTMEDRNLFWHSLYEDRVAPICGTYQATATNPIDSACWLGAVAAFKAR